MSGLYFTRPGGYENDTAYMRFPRAEPNCEAVIVTKDGGTRRPTPLLTLGQVQRAVAAGECVIEITEDEAHALLVAEAST